MISFLLKIDFSNVTERVHGLGSIRQVWLWLWNINIQSENKKIGSSNQHVSACSSVMLQCVSCKIRLGGGVCESFKINRKTFLHMHVNISYLEPLVIYYNS